MASSPSTGTAAGVPYLAVPPATPRPESPIVLGWHLMDSPRTEAAFAAAVPLHGLDAWRIYLGLPMCGARMPAGGPEELMRLGFEDAVLNLQGPVTADAAAEFAPALAELRSQLPLGNGPLGLFGGSVGAAAALLVMAETGVPVEAAVLISPLIQLRPGVDAMARQFEFSYPWSAQSLAVATRLDFVERAEDIAGQDEPAVLLVVGADDDQAGFADPAGRLRAALTQRYADPRRVELVTIAGMGHALAEEPGLEPAPQTPHAGEVDRHAVRWFAQHLAG